MSLPSSRPAADPPALRLYQAGETDSEGDVLSSRMTLGEFFRAYMVPEYLAMYCSPLTLKDYAGTIAYWKTHTGDPPLDLIDELTGNAFVRGLRGEPMEDNTIRKHLSNVQTCLAMAAGGTKRASGVRLLERAPTFRKPSLVLREVEDAFTLDEISQILAACHLVDRPKFRYLTTREFWQAVVVLDYNSALRIESLQKAERAWLEPIGQGAWLHLRRAARKGKKSGQRVYLNAAALRACEVLRVVPHARIVPVDYSYSWFNKWLGRLLAAAKIPEARRFKWHAFRKACGGELAAINDMAARWHLGHAGGGRKSGSVTLDHYVKPEKLIAAVERLPQPTWHRDREGQQLLFAF